MTVNSEDDLDGGLEFTTNTQLANNLHTAAGSDNGMLSNSQPSNLQPSNSQPTHPQPSATNRVNPQTFQQGAEQVTRLKQAVSSALIGQDLVIHQLTLCILAGGHALIEGLPGLGKTLMVKAFAKAIGGSHHRVQFTPDLMPADITGHTLYDMKNGSWKIRKGPVFCNLLLADEINRASAKTQSALLEVMQEQQVTIEGTTHQVQKPFTTIATQNPLEQEGTYPLPEAQLDRFLFNILIDYPSHNEELTMLKTVLTDNIGGSLDLSAVPQVMTTEGLVELQQLVAKVSIDERVMDYALQIIRATRNYQGISAGAGPRGGIAILRAARAEALTKGRAYVIPDDVVNVTVPVLRHRLRLNADYQIDGIATDQVIRQLLQNIPAPRQ